MKHTWIVGILAALAALGVHAQSPPAGVRIFEAAAPAGLESQPLSWVNIETTGNGTMRAAIVRPKGKGPFPAVLLVHGSHGFAREYLDLAREISAQKFVTVAACWFRGGNESTTVSPPIDCPEARPIPMAPSAEARATIADLVAAVRSLPDVRADRVAIFGHSRGAGATINYLEHGGDVRAAILNSSGYTDEYIAEVSQIHASIFVLHGMRDNNSEMTQFERARRFSRALREAKIRELTIFYPEGDHLGIFIDPDQRADEVSHIVHFLELELR